jgi:hypothetical protein
MGAILYVATSKNLSRRVCEHSRAIERRRNGVFKKDDLHAYEVLTEENWSVTFHALAMSCGDSLGR